MKKILVICLMLLIAMSAIAFSGCGVKSVAEGEPVDLYAIPDGCEFVPHDQFMSGYALLCDTSPDAVPINMDVLEDAFGTEGYYFENSDVIEEGYIYKTYGWFSEESWIDGKIAVGVIFKAPEGTEDFIYYMYISQGITYEDVQ